LSRRAFIAIFVCAVVLLGGWIVRARNRWPEEMTRELAQLRAAGEPLTLAECDRRYNELGATPTAFQHFQRAFGAMSKGELPLMDSKSFAAQKTRHPLPHLEAMASIGQRTVVMSCLRTNTESLRLLHEGMAYERCFFPIKLSDGLQALLPHLPEIRRAAHLLALESVEYAYDGDSKKAVESILACLHMAEILGQEPTLIGMIIRDRIMGDSCEAIRVCINVAPMPSEDLIRISQKLSRIMAMAEKADRSALITERCQWLAIFQGTDQQIADFMAEGHGGVLMLAGVEMLRVKGVLQRDAGFFLDRINGIEAASTRLSNRDIVEELDVVASEVETNRIVGTGNETRVNILSCEILPSIIRAMRIHLWTQALSDAVIASLSVEQYRQATGHLPDDLQVLVPEYLPEIPKGPFLNKPLRLKK
jgi:hypothetical protein